MHDNIYLATLRQIDTKDFDGNQTYSDKLVKCNNIRIHSKFYLKGKNNCLT